MSELIGLLLCEHSFLQNFNQDWLSTITFCYYDKSFGHKNILEHVPVEKLDVLVVDRQCDYRRNHFICWLRALKPQGVLAIEAIENESPEKWVEKLSHQITYLAQPNERVWIFIKKALEFTVPIENKEQYCQLLSIDINRKTARGERSQAVTDLLLWEVLEPNNYAIPILLSRILRSLGQNTEADIIMNDFVQRMPNYQNLFYQSLDYLAIGDYSLGFKLRNKLQLPDARRTKLVPTDEQLLKRWQGESVKGRTFVIWTELGLGDEIMFSQLAYYFKQQGVKKLVIIVQSPIAALLQTHPDIDVVVDYREAEKDLPPFDYWCYPHVILAFIEQPFSLIPKRHPYLFADEKDVHKFQSQIRLTTNLKVGIAWRGDPTHENDRLRSIHNLDYIRSLFELPHIDWYCLQKNCNENELSLLSEFNIPHIAAHCENMAETAAVISQLDYVISVDTSVIHLAGALGADSAVMLPYIVDWRWGYKDSSTLWYPNMQLFRNPNPSGDWGSVIKEIKESLRIKATIKQLCL